MYYYLPLLLLYSNQYYAILIGVNDYRNASSLRYAEKDAQDLAKTLQDYGYTVRLLVGKDVHKQAIQAFIQEFSRQSKTNDVLLVAFSGHGIGGTAGSRKGIITYWDDIERGDFYSQQDLIRDMLSFRGHRYLVLDACYQGTKYTGSQRLGADASLIQNAIKANQLDLFIAASSSDRAAYEGVRFDGRIVENGVATYLLLQGIKDGAADKDGDGTITIGEMIDYIDRMVGRLSGQIFQKPEGSMTFYNAPLVEYRKFKPQGPAAPRSKEMILIKSGSFHMGNTRNDNEGNPNEKPVHQVQLTYSYWISPYETTFAEYDAFCDETGSTKPRDTGWGRGDQPVIRVSWNDAVAFCNWLSGKECLKPAYDSRGNLLDRNGRITTDITKVEGYRLPTEAEWEYAARGGHLRSSDFLYSGSNQIEDGVWYFRNSGNRAQPEGTKKPNQVELYDMSGNVSEWCYDWWKDYTSASQNNPIGPHTGSQRVVRGGNWYTLPANCRISYRAAHSPNTRTNEIGFRVVRTDIK